jgi:FAD/FMN-containing dehydrogenase
VRWRNRHGNQSIDVARICEPDSLPDLVALVKQAEREKVSVRAVGSGHSWSDVALTDGYVVLPKKLRKPLPLREDLLRRQPKEPNRFVRVEGGMRIRELNRWLWDEGLGLPNMGGYDGQTIAGATSTSTHGSGMQFGPLHEIVRSIDMVAAKGVVYRIEPAAGPTERAAWEAEYPQPDWQLVQDDGWFAAAVVGIGCLGVIYSMILEVEPRRLLKEVREASTWEDVRDSIPAEVADKRHYELYLTPYPRRGDGKHLCMVTTRTVATELPPWWSSRRRRRLRAELLARLPGLGHVLNLVVRAVPRLTPFLLSMAVRAIADDEYTNRSYRVLNIGAANVLPVLSAEIAVRFDDRSYVAAFETIARVAERQRGHAYHSAPMAVRFVKRSSAFLSMMHERETVMFELILLSRTKNGLDLLAAYERELMSLGARPHWGQVNHLDARPRLLAELYPGSYDAWRAIHAQLNSTGVFTGRFPQRVGIRP